jgi:1-acyl-sn-glycerol-3-phosphate acyltransferase
MYRPYSLPVVQASPDIQTPEPYISKGIKPLLKILARPYLCLFIGRAKVVLRDGRRLFGAFDRALKKQSRLLVGFLHPYGAEPQILGWWTLFRLKSLAQKQGFTFALPPHIRFIHGYEVLRWGGPVARFVLPRIGAMPVYHAKLDSASMERIYKALTDGPYPIAIAPEGQVSYFSGTVPRLEQGMVRMGFTVAERLANAAGDGRSNGRQGAKAAADNPSDDNPADKSRPDNRRPPDVEILPLAVCYRYGKNGKKAMEKLLLKTEKCLGLEDGGLSRTEHPAAAPLAERFRRCRDALIAKNEERYGIAARDAIHPITDRTVPPVDRAADGGTEDRIAAVMEKAISRAEAILGVRAGGGDRVPRLHALRQICWDNIFIPNKASLDGMPQIDRSIADLRAGEAWHASRHLEIADFVWCMNNVPVPTESSPLHEQVEYAQNLWDFANRTMGGVFGMRICIHPQKIIFNPAPIINLSERLEAYHGDRRGTIEKTMGELKAAYLECIRSDEDSKGA